ncbi:hemerythrin domain-containing protein [Microbacterium sp. NIBRBAC000506063]|uniref:hemerythrin domain-containing protein n=1 Tax=Microbacterium sp. NIBRBAC000506063 TaxID=2734618 RepID=UPI001BB7CBBD|nr:hemerythrin domain-containing protein [Microbacterium sp. NIBRBAC000506063]QTV80142.1 hemerythrin domain-containing protein [Microbacterium sp. NIBRBAC000506063]
MTERETRRLIAWADELRRVHARLRKALAVAQEAVASGLGGDAATRELLLYCHGFCVALDEHHRGEDRTLFPALAARHPELAPVIRALEQDHSMIAHLLGGLSAALERAAPPAEIARHLEGVSAIRAVGVEHDVVVGHDRLAGAERLQRRLDLDLQRAERGSFLVELDPGGGHMLKGICVVDDPRRCSDRDAPRCQRGLAVTERERLDTRKPFEVLERFRGRVTDDGDDGSSDGIAQRVGHTPEYARHRGRGRSALGEPAPWRGAAAAMVSASRALGASAL